MAEGTEIGISDDVEDDKADHKHDDQEREADEKEDALAKGVPLAKGDVRNKDDG